MVRKLEIKIHDGTLLRGHLYAAQPKAPVIIMSAGLSGIKEHFLPTYAARLNKEGYSVVTYDHRTWGRTSSSNPTYIPIYPETLDESHTSSNGVMMGTEECFRHYADIRNIEPFRVNKITLQTLFHVMRSEPQEYISQISPKPLLMVVGVRDSLIDAQKQIAAFQKAKEPKELLELDCGHFDIYRGEIFEQNIATQIAFLKKYL
ncbi:alpha/beta hydrolase [Aspergillus novofumigatus IBT 16806]|uniref:Alpha/beta-hydrolase n=1 Tax=Aspergillus novofumigatus (strain IBT 16806) TaxID=1392255 RepID=A0A2I1C7A8_ASPN1|nr:alpha/beta-hydrolase [Aspergillus novofumigatus IBT 16806]PKX93527.1 alpha/beta-hydrolase [Aspergillus novofumigatus IBT 16806]